jgi:hypothetical protein
MLHGAWATNERLAALWDGKRMPDDIVARWERILAIRPRASDSMQARRERVAEKFASAGTPALPGVLAGTLSSDLGDFFVAIEHIGYSIAKIYVPDGTYPWGTTSTVSPWYSTVAYVLVKLQKPTGYTEAEFYERAGQVFSLVDALVPAWVVVDWYREPVSGGISVSGGPSSAGFFLDDEHNLDNNVFDV